MKNLPREHYDRPIRQRATWALSWLLGGLLTLLLTPVPAWSPGTGWSLAYWLLGAPLLLLLTLEPTWPLHALRGLLRVKSHRRRGFVLH